MAKDELLPCPFGCEPEDAAGPTLGYSGSVVKSEGGAVNCAICGCDGPWCATEAEAVAAWNTRYTKQPDEANNNPEVSYRGPVARDPDFAARWQTERDKSALTTAVMIDSVIERAARAICAAEGLDPDAMLGVSDDAPQWPRWQLRVPDVRAVLQAIREPTPFQVATVVQQVGDPSPDNWALAENVCLGLAPYSVEGETACAELVRDWQAMLDYVLAETPSEP